ncbi:MAG: hypothetical protein OXC05_14410 [Halieaceae bacterium]|nr:hypothetical protein [Halieaceae bacterium]
MQSSIADTTDRKAGYAVTKLSMEEILAQKGFGFANEKQKWAEDLSTEIMKAEPIRAVLTEIEKRFKQDPAYQLPGAAAIAADAAYTLVYRTVTYVVTEDPLRPMLLWSYNTGRQDGNKIVPNVSFIDSADSLYRMITLGKGYHYEITGKMADNPAAYITFEAWNAAQGLAPTVAYVTHVQSDTMTIADDGTFSVFAGPEENPGYDNYLHLPEGGWIYVRESMTDWAAQRPIEDLQIKVLDDLEIPAPTFDELVARSVEVMHQSFDVYQTYLHKMFAEDDKNLYISFGNKPNTLRPQVATRGGAWGCVTGTLFTIPEDKALVVTIKTGDADYFAIQLHDAWGRALIPIYLTNRNKNGSALNPDGSVTYVLAHTDPGVANWLDVKGHQSGSLIVRWQGLDVPADGSPAELVHGAQLVDRSELDNVLPEGTARTTAAQREHELAIRKAAWSLRGKD